MKVVIVEDEPLSAEHLTLLLQRIDSRIEVVAQPDTVKATVAALNNGMKPDLLFLDIHLADGNGFDIFAKTGTDVPVIFTTAYDNYAIEAFKQNSIHYLLKPISLPDLRGAMEKFGKQLQMGNSELMGQLSKALQPGYKSRFMVKVGQNIDFVQTADIQHFESTDGLAHLVTNKGDRYAIDHSMDKLEELLDPKNFFRINRSTIIQITAIQKVQQHINGRFAVVALWLAGDARIVSRERVGDFKKWLDS